MTKILTTTNYNLFKFLKNNRPIGEKRVLNLMSIMKEFPNFFQFSPVKCNPEHEVLDGQHRVEAAKRLKIPIAYQIVEGVTIEQIRDSNDYKADWTTKDYIYSHEAENNKNYQLYREFQTTYGFDLSAALMLLTGLFSHNRLNSEKFKNGKFVVTHMEDAVMVANMLEKIKAFHKPASTKHFIVAFNKFRTHPNFVFSTFLTRLEANPKFLQKASNTKTYCENLCEVWNYRVAKVNKIDPRDFDFSNKKEKKIVE